MHMYNSKADNFDILLLVQSIQHLKADPLLKDDFKLLGKLHDQMHKLNAQVLTHIEVMSIHEYVTIANFFLSNLSSSVCSTTLAEGILSKLIDSVAEFNELQLVMFKKI